MDKDMKVVFLILAFLGLNAIDAVTTLHLIGHDKAVEINPLMDHLLSIGPMTFFAVKMFLAGVAAFFMASWKPRLLYVAIGFFLAICSWQLFLLLGGLP